MLTSTITRSPRQKPPHNLFSLHSCFSEGELSAPTTRHGNATVHGIEPNLARRFAHFISHAVTLGRQVSLLGCQVLPLGRQVSPLGGPFLSISTVWSPFKKP
jgi:hypothetical protein